ncbi:MAG: hypothetical protein K6G18_04185 [Treponema sp.]|nr:hypothetical protein [Treponema sp.]
MTDSELRIFKRYSRDLDFYRLELNLTKLLLNDTVVKRVIDRYCLKKAYIHGTDFLGELSYNSIKKYIEVLGVIGSSIKSTAIPDAKIITEECFFEKKESAPVIITELNDARNIYMRLSQCAGDLSVYYLGELFSFEEHS